MLWTVPCFFLFGFQFMDCVSAGNQCREEVSVSGMALKGFVFKKFSVRALHECDISCEREITCQSYNYAAGEKSCELNNRTKEARPENFRSDPAWFYKRRLSDRAPLGSIPELPAQSCQEIKASEGKDTISSKYWLDPTGTGTAVLVYCDMKLEDIDECITGIHDCDVNANCTNIVGGHNCTCKEGYTGDGRSCSGCSLGWIHYGNSCYHVSNTTTRSWNEARTTCQNLGGDLPIIKSVYENDFILGLLEKAVQLGLHRKNDNKFYWVDGTALEGQYSAWASGEPNNVNEKCVMMYSGGSKAGRWNDTYCQKKDASVWRFLLCQKNPNPP